MRSYQQKLQASFEEEYKKLNSEQRTAVDNLDGPVMVIAGQEQEKHKFLPAGSVKFY